MNLKRVAEGKQVKIPVPSTEEIQAGTQQGEFREEVANSSKAQADDPGCKVRPER